MNRSASTRRRMYMANSIAPYPRDKGWAVPARRIVGVSLALWAFVAGLAYAILRVAGVL